MGKRHRPLMKRTTSMKDVAGAMPSHQEMAADAVYGNQLQKRQNLGPQRTSAVFPAATGLFLRACALCNARLGPDRDIFMYRGEMAFCSTECRENQIKHDERKEKVRCFISSMETSAQANVAN